MRQPQPLATDDVRRALRMLVEVDVPILGVVENLSGSLAPDGAAHRLFGEGGGRMLADDYGVPLFGELSIDPALRALCDQGRPAARAIADPSSRGLLEARNRSEGGAPVRTAFFPVPPPRSSPYGGGRSGFDVPAPGTARRDCAPPFAPRGCDAPRS